MKLAFSTNAYTRFSLANALRDIKVAGFNAVEILADVPHAYPDLLDDQTVAAIRHELDSLGLEVSNINANCAFGYWGDAPSEPYFEPSLISPDPKMRSDRARLIRRAIRFAAEVGAKNVSITSGRCLGSMSPDKAAVQFVESIKPLLAHADAFGINLGIECEPGLYVEYVAELHDWIDQLDHPRLGANLDIGHSQVIGENLRGAIELLGDRIWNLHVEDIPGRKHYHLIPGQGTLDWSAVHEGLKAIHYDRYVTVELYTHTENPQAAARESFSFLSKTFGQP